MRTSVVRSLLLVPLLLAAVAPAAAGVIEDNIAAYDPETAEGYLRPLSEGLGQSLNTGLFTTAHVPREGLHVRLEFHLMSVFYGNDDETFMARPGSDFENQDPVVAPTVVGPGEAPDPATGSSGAEFAFPGGLDLGSASLVMPQLTIGSLYGTEGTVRWIGIETGDSELGKVNLFGIGARHSVSQWFEDWPVEVAASVFYQTFTSGDDDLLDGSAFSLGAQVSREYGAFEPFGSITFDQWRMKVKYTRDEDTLAEEEVTVDFDTDTNLHFLAGVGVRVSVLRLYGAINFAQRMGISAGFSLGN